MDSSEAKRYLESLLNQEIQVHTQDERMFVGEFKCTDNDSNIILSRAFEYRMPSPKAVKAAAAANILRTTGNFKLDMTSRFVGLIVVPGEYITKIELAK